jgi:hypothetical protein
MIRTDEFGIWFRYPISGRTPRCGRTGAAAGTICFFSCNARISLSARYASARACATVRCSATMQPHKIVVSTAIVARPGPVIRIRLTCASNLLSKLDVLINQTYQTRKGVAACHRRAIPARPRCTLFFSAASNLGSAHACLTHVFLAFFLFFSASLRLRGEENSCGFLLDLSARSSHARVLQRLRQVVDDVLHRLNPHREPHQAVRNSHALTMLGG